MKHAIALVAAAGLASMLALPAQVSPAQAQTSHNSTSLRAQGPAVEHTDISAQRRHYQHPRYGYGHRHYYRGPRYGYYRPYRPYRHYGPYAYGPGIGLGFYGGPGLGVWF